MIIELKIPVLEEVNAKLEVLIGILSRDPEETAVNAVPQEEKAEEAFDDEFTILTPDVEGPFDDPVTLDDVKKKFIEVYQANKNNQKRLIELLSDYNAASVSELKENDFPEVMKALENFNG